MTPTLTDLLEVWLNNRRGWKLFRRKLDDTKALAIIESDFMSITVWPEYVVGMRPRLFKEEELVKIYIADPEFFRKLQELMNAGSVQRNFEKLFWSFLDVIGHMLRWKDDRKT